SAKYRRANGPAPQKIEELPDGAMIVLERRAFLIRGDAILPWSFDGYGACEKRPTSGVVSTLTPPSILRALKAGYDPRWG
ncbi:MAG TPA: hypothetical protein VKS78_19100, partial [Roseiarcus sp.]|nr:hypothetical protein [Roseiarcus sp.]